LPRNQGRGQARNVAIEHAAGTYVAICDGDDISLPERFAKEAAFLEARPEIGIVSAQVEFFWRDAPPRIRFLYPETPEAIERRFAKGKMAVSHAAAMIRRECFARAGGYVHSGRAEDFELFLRLRRFYRFAALPDVLVRYRHEVKGIAFDKWIEMMQSHRYALYHAQSVSDAAAPVAAFDDYIARPSVKARIYTIDMARLLKFTLRSHVAARHQLR
jgi:glycosyltransferase involved in cell wall biosynthesis